MPDEPEYLRQLLVDREIEIERLQEYIQLLQRQLDEAKDELTKRTQSPEEKP